MHWPEPTMLLDPSEMDEPVLVTIRYQVPSDRAGAFVEAMDAVRRSRLRTGALRWDLYQDGAHPEVYLETFLVASWEEHLRQHGGRLTGHDREEEDQARSLVASGFEVSHYLPARVRPDG
jgi:transmembrane secretion effector